MYNNNDYSEIVNEANKKLSKQIIKYLDKMGDHVTADYTDTIQELFRIVSKSIVKHNLRSFKPDYENEYDEEVNETYKFIASNMLSSIEDNEDAIKCLIKDAVNYL